MAEKSVPRNHLSDAHKWTTIHVLQKQLSICIHTVVITINKPGLKSRYRNGWHYSGILKVSSISRWKRRKGIIFWIDLESIQHNLSSDYSLDICFSRRFPYTDGPSFSPYKPQQNVDFSKVGNMQVFFRNCTHMLKRTQRKKFEDIFLVKIASKGTSLIPDSFVFHTWRTFQLEKNNNGFWAVGKCSKVLCTVSCWHKEISLRLLT